MLNEVWILVSALLIFIGLVASQGLLLVVGSLVIVIALVARLWDRFAFRRVTHTRKLSRQRAFIGDSLEYSVTLNNDKILPLIWVDIQDAFPEGLELAGEHLRSAGMDMAQQHRNYRLSVALSAGHLEIFPPAALPGASTASAPSA